MANPDRLLVNDGEGPGALCNDILAMFAGRDQLRAENVRLRGSTNNSLTPMPSSRPRAAILSCSARSSSMKWKCWRRRRRCWIGAVAQKDQELADVNAQLKAAKAPETFHSSG